MADAATVALAIDLVRHLVLRPGGKQLVYVNLLLEVSSHEDEEIRTGVLGTQAPPQRSALKPMRLLSLYLLTGFY